MVKAVAVLSSSEGVNGTIQFTQDGDGPTTVTGNVTGLKPGLHGFHVHALGDTTNGCISTGPHFNPDGKLHGAPEDDDRHAGDLGNITVAADGTASFTITDKQLKQSTSMDTRLSRRRFRAKRKGRGGKVVCIPCFLRSWDDNDALYIYTVDLSSSSDDNKVMSPRARLDLQVFKAWSVCVFKSTVYLVKNWEGGTSVATFDLGRCLGSGRTTVDLTDDMLTYVSCMHRPKRCPVVTSTPDGKILVFSSFILRNDDNGIDFELYDPETNCWHQIPQIEDTWGRAKRSFWIEAFGFPKKCILLIKTDNAGLFELDLESLTWRVRDRLAGVGHLRYHAGYFSATDEGLCFSAGGVFDIKSPGGADILCCDFAEESNPFATMDDDDYYSKSAGGIAFFDGGWKFCLIQTAVNVETGYPEMSMHIYGFDIAKYKVARQELVAKYLEEKSKLRDKYGEKNQRGKHYRRNKGHYIASKLHLRGVCGTPWLDKRVEKSLKFMVGAREECRSFIPESLCVVST